MNVDNMCSEFVFLVVFGLSSDLTGSIAVSNELLK
jgi:hypothetical protein